MTRRDFLARMGLAAGTVALSPLLDLAPILEAPSQMAFNEQYTFKIFTVYNLMVDNPRRLGVVSAIL